MNNTEFLAKALNLQKEFAELYGESGLVGISSNYIHVIDDKFHELERKGLLEHISKVFDEKEEMWRCEAMTPGGVKVIALGQAIEYVSEMEDKR